MKEITRITVVQFTDIRKVDDSELAAALAEKDTLADTVKNDLRAVLDVDDALLLDAKDFVRDITEEEGTENGNMENAE